MSKVKLLLFIYLLLAIHLISFAQSSNPKSAGSLTGSPPKTITSKSPPPSKEARDNSENKEDYRRLMLSQRSLLLIKDVVGEAMKMDDLPNIVKIKEAAASAIWKKEPEYAKKLFREAFQEARKYYQDQEHNELARFTNNLSMSRPDLRLEVIRQVSRLDSKLSHELSDKYSEDKLQQEEKKRQSYPGKISFSPVFGKVDSSASDLLQVAQLLIDSDRNAALDLTQRAFLNGVPMAAGYFFTMVASKDKSFADQTYAMALARLQQEADPVPGQLLLLAAYPFGDNQVLITSGNGMNKYQFQVPPNVGPNSQLIQQFLTVSLYVLMKAADVDGALFPDANERIGAALFAAQLLLPKVLQYQPQMSEKWLEVTARLQIRMTDPKQQDGLEKDVKEASQASQLNASLEAEDRIQKLLNQAEKTPDLLRRDDLYQEAVFEVDQQDDTDRALNIAEKITKIEFRQKTKNWVYFNAASREIKKNRLEEARRLALQITALDERAYLLLKLARSVLSGKNRAHAQEWLNEAYLKSLEADNTPAKLRTLIGLANLFAQFEPLRGFDVASEAVKTANKIPTFDRDQSRLIRTFETRTGRGERVVVEEGNEFDLGAMLASLSNFDFDGALLLAKSVENKPLSLMSILAIAATAIQSEPKVQ